MINCEECEKCEEMDNINDHQIIQPKVQSNGNKCEQKGFDYNEIENALCGSETFDVKRLFVIEMIQTEEQKERF